MRNSRRLKRMSRNRVKIGKMNLTSLMDVFTILVFFLLVNSSDVETLPNTKDLQLPESIAEEKAKETVVILIGEVDLIVQGTPVAKIDTRMRPSRASSMTEPKMMLALGSTSSRIRLAASSTS